MKRALFIAILVALAAGAVAAYAQDEYYDDGTDFGEDADRGPVEQGPSSIAEAKAQGRGFRITGNGAAARAPGVTTGGKDTHVVNEGDTLWDISDRYFGDPYHWPELWSFNPEITNPHWIYPADQLRLSPKALGHDHALAQARAGGGVPEKDPTGKGLISGTEMAPRVVVPKEMFTPGTVFLRDQGYLDDEGLRAAGRIIGGNEEQMLMAPSDQVYIRFSSNQDIKPGQSYSIIRAIPKEERIEEAQGKLVRILGTAVVRSYDRNTGVARGLVSEALDPIERGLMVAKLDRRFDLVPPARNRVNVTSRIKAAVEPHTLLAEGSVVFVDIGEGHGIEPGNRFFVTRRGDNWLETAQADPVDLGNVAEVPTYERKQLPKEVVAELRVVKVRKTVTIALVTRSDTDLTIGDVCEMRAGF